MSERPNEQGASERTHAAAFRARVRERVLADPGHRDLVERRRKAQTDEERQELGQRIAERVTLLLRLEVLRWRRELQWRQRQIDQDFKREVARLRATGRALSRRRTHAMGFSYAKQRHPHREGSGTGSGT